MATVYGFALHAMAVAVRTANLLVVVADAGYVQYAWDTSVYLSLPVELIWRLTV